MPFEVKQVGNEPIIVATIIPPIDTVTEPQLTGQAANEIARRFKGTVYRITDLSLVNLSYEEMVMGMADDIKHSEPNMEHVFVGPGELVELATESMKLPQYGAKGAQLVKSLEEAIAYARKQLNG